MDEKTAEFNKHIVESTTELTRLNLQVMSKINDIVQRDFVSELSNIKKPEDFVALQLKVAASSGVEMMSYIQKSGDVMSRYWAGFTDIAQPVKSRKSR